MAKNFLGGWVAKFFLGGWTAKHSGVGWQKFLRDGVAKNSEGWGGKNVEGEVAKFFERLGDKILGVAIFLFMTRDDK